MMRKLLLIALTLSCSLTVRGQLNEMEAKAAYLLAEENYNKADYPTTLKFLDKAKKSLGGTNSKLLYLQIMTELELYKKDASYYDNVIASITEFQSAPDVKTFNQEKVLEVVKAKMTIMDQRKKQIAKEAASKARNEAFEQNIKSIGFVGWPLGISMTELMEINKSSPVFSKKLKTKAIEGIGLEAHISKLADELGGIIIFTNDGKVVGYRKIIYHNHNYDDKSVSDEEAKEYAVSIIKNMSRNFGFNPIIEDNTYYDIFKWSKYNKTVNIYRRHVFYGKKNWVMTVVQDVIKSGFDLSSFPPNIIF